MNMTKIILSLAVLLATPAWAQRLAPVGESDAAFVAGGQNGVFSNGCAHTTLANSTQTRVQLSVGYWYLVQCVVPGTSGLDGTEPCSFIQGNSTIDVTSIGGSMYGYPLFQGDHWPIYVKSTSVSYVSAIAKTAGTILVTCRVN